MPSSYLCPYHVHQTAVDTVPLDVAQNCRGVKGGKGEEERWEEREDFKEAKRERADASEGN